MPNYTAPRPGVGSVGQYQMSSKPYATSSFSVAGVGSAPTEITFPNVTSWVWVENLDSNSNVRIGFSSLGTTGSAGGGTNNYVTIVNQTDPHTFRVRVKSVFLLSEGAASTNVSIMAGLTSIESDLSTDEGPNYSGSSGIG